MSCVIFSFLYKMSRIRWTSSRPRTNGRRQLVLASVFVLCILWMWTWWSENKKDKVNVIVVEEHHEGTGIYKCISYLSNCTVCA